MKYKLLFKGPDTFAVIFDKGDEFSEGMLRFAREARVTAAAFTAIGAFREATLGYFDRERKDYEKIPVREQVEVVSLTGNIARLDNGEPKVHAHAVIAGRDGAARGGHLVDARVWPTLEVTVVASPAGLRRTADAETGLALIDLDAPAAG